MHLISAVGSFAQSGTRYDTAVWIGTLSLGRYDMDLGYA